jgi:hypothetical protein
MMTTMKKRRTSDVARARKDHADAAPRSRQAHAHGRHTYAFCVAMA